MKQKYLYIGSLLLAAVLTTVACHEDDYNGNAPRFNDGKLHFAVTTLDQWTPETRAASSRVNIIDLDEETGGEGLCLVIDEQLMGDTLQPTTRGQRYTSTEDDYDDNTKWDGTASNHHMHESFAMLGMMYTGNYSDWTDADNWTGAEVWTDLGNDGLDFCQIKRPASPGTDGLYEIWDWDINSREDPSTLEEVNWPGNNQSVFLFACAPAQIKINYGIQFVGEDGKAPYINYTVPDTPIDQQDLMIATRNMSSSDIAKTTAGGSENKDIKLNFQHICTAVKFRLLENSNANGTPSSKIKSITMKNVLRHARFTYDATEIESTTTTLGGSWAPEPGFTPTNETGPERGDMTFEFVNSTSGEPSPKEWTNSSGQVVADQMLFTDDNVFMMIPQKFDENDLVISLNCLDSNNKEYTLKVTIKKEKLHEWKAGHVVIYNITRSDQVTVQDNFSVTAVHDDLTPLDPSSEMEGGIPVYDRNGTSNITFQVKSYRTVTIGSSISHDYSIPWEISGADLQDGSGVSSGNNYEKGELPDMISMDTQELTITNSETGENKTVYYKTWGTGGNITTDTLHANVNFPSKRGDFEGSDAIVKVVNRNPFGTKESPQDLSMLGLNGVPTTTRNTANCYVVSAAGYYSIPLVFGNGIVGGVNNDPAYGYATVPHDVNDPTLLAQFVDAKGNYITQPWIPDEATQAFVLWETSDSLVTQLNVETRKDPVTEEYHQFLNFAITPRYINLGNAVIAVADASGILWSWHIWVNDYNEVNKPVKVYADEMGTGGDDYEFMEVNLGWTDGYYETLRDSICEITFRQFDPDDETANKTQSVTIKRTGGGRQAVPGTGGTYYQHGRKDPFPSVAVSPDPSDTYSHNTGETTINLRKSTDMMVPAENQEKYLYDRKYTLTVNKATSTAANKSIAYAIAHPYEMLITNDKSNWFDKPKDGAATVPYYDNLWTMVTYDMPEREYDDNDASTQATEARENLHEEVFKTIYDPCPVGYCIPNLGAFKAFYQVEEKTDGYYDDFIYNDQDNGGTIQLGDFDIFIGKDNSSSPRIHNYDLGKVALVFPMYSDTTELIAAVKGDLKDKKKYTVNRLYDNNRTVNQSNVTDNLGTPAPDLTPISDTYDDEHNILANPNKHYWLYQDYIKNMPNETPVNSEKPYNCNFAHAKILNGTQKLQWKRKVSSFNGQARFEGIEGLVYTNKNNEGIFFPSAGTRNPKLSGRMETEDGHQTFNYGGYYATACITPDDGVQDYGLKDTQKGEQAATFFWIQQKTLHDGLKSRSKKTSATQADNFNRINEDATYRINPTKLIDEDKIPLFDQYNRQLTYNEHKKYYHSDCDIREIFIYRYETHDELGLISGLSGTRWCAGSMWGVKKTGSGLEPSCEQVTPSGSEPSWFYPATEAGRRVRVQFYKKWGPTPYTVRSWGRERSYAVSVRPIKDKQFKEEVGVGIITTGDQTPYRDTRSRRTR